VPKRLDPGRGLRRARRARADAGCRAHL